MRGRCQALTSSSTLYEPELTGLKAPVTQKELQASPVSQRVPSHGDAADIMKQLVAKFAIGEIVKHRKYPFRGIIYDVDPEFANTEEWWQSIPEEVRPRKDQPFYHLFAENAETEYVAYVSEQNLLPDTSGDPMRHPQVDEMFNRDNDGAYLIKSALLN
jgi:heat shock protein HspQ